MTRMEYIEKGDLKTKISLAEPLLFMLEVLSRTSIVIDYYLNYRVDSRYLP